MVSAASAKRRWRQGLFCLLLIAATVIVLNGFTPHQPGFTPHQPTPNTEPLPSSSNLPETADKLDGTNSADRRQNSGATIALAVTAALHSQSIALGYAKAGVQDSKARGVSWLKHAHGLELAGWLQVVQGNNASGEAPQESVRVTITEVTGKSCDPANLRIWARLRGPEMFAGTVHPAPSEGCAWQTTFPLSTPGDYEVDVRLIGWNLKANFHVKNCNVSEVDDIRAFMGDGDGDAGDEGAVFGRDLTGWKFYDPNEGCCEACQRETGCVDWVTPGHEGFACFLRYDTPEHRDLFLSGTGAPLPEGKAGSYGTRRSGEGEGEPAYFIGCGWSFHLGAEHSCTVPDLEGAVPLVSNSLQVTPSSTVIVRETPIYAALKRALEDDDDDVAGDDAADDAEDDDAVAEAEQRALEVLWERYGDNTNTELPVCGAGQGGHGRWVKAPQSAHCETHTPVHTEAGYLAGTDWRMARLNSGAGLCWLGDDLNSLTTKFAEGKAGALASTTWTSPLGAAVYYGYWAPWDCKFKVYDRADVQECVTRRNIAGFDYKGASTKVQHQETMAQFLEGIEFGTGSVRVTVDTLSFPHLLWHMAEEEVEARFAAEKSASEDEILFWVSNSYVSSEREPHVNVVRGERFGRIIRSVLKPKGWIELPWYNLTAAFTYDSAGQSDGLHIYGPPMKNTALMMLNYLCQ